MGIPKTFRLGGVEWKTAPNDLIAQGSWMGRCNQRSKLIEYRTKVDSESKEKISPSSILNTFYHELVHAILGTMAEWELNDNEKFIQGFANLLTEYETSSHHLNNERKPTNSKEKV